MSETNDIIRKELTENNYWLDNQDELAKGNAALKNENSELRSSRDWFKHELDKALNS